MQILQCNWIIENSFSKVSILFSYIAQSILFVLLLVLLKKTGIQFKCNNVLRNEDKKYKILSILPYSWTNSEITPLSIKWMTSQAYNNNVQGVIIVYQQERTPDQGTSSFFVLTLLLYNFE